MENIYNIRISIDDPKVLSNDISLPLLKMDNDIVAQLIYKDANGESVLLPLSYEYNREFLWKLIDNSNGNHMFHIQLTHRLINRDGKLFRKLYIKNILFDVANVDILDIVI